MEEVSKDYEFVLQNVYESSLINGDIAVDIGAHVGRHSIPMARSVHPKGKVFAIEPLPVCREQLGRAILAGGKQLENIIEIYPYALSNFAGGSEFVVAADDLAYSGLKTRIYDRPTKLEKIRVQVARFDDLFLGMASIRYIKIDAEGGEFHILQGATQSIRKFRPLTSFEFGINSLAEYKVGPSDMFEFWSENSYKIYDINGVCLSILGDFVESATAQRVWDYIAIPRENTVLENTILKAIRGTGWAESGARKW